MSEHIVTISWELQTESFDYATYNRKHSIDFEGHNRLCASAAPDFHPEQSFVAALASCHMLTFLAIASKKGFVVTAYSDSAVGILGKNKAGLTAITQITLNPIVAFSEDYFPAPEVFDQLHVQAHKGCFIANSIASCIHVEINARFSV
jgi:organic hydroperoxide reductase OsmC/OhrA